MSSKIRPLLCSQALHEQTVSQPTVQLDGRMDNENDSESNGIHKYQQYPLRL